jgi:hypothetical protein
MDDTITPALHLTAEQMELAMDVVVDRALAERIPVLLAGMRGDEVVLLRGATPGRYPGALLVVPDAVESAARLRGRTLPVPVKRLTRADGRSVLVYDLRPVRWQSPN